MNYVAWPHKHTHIFLQMGHDFVLLVTIVKYDAQINIIPEQSYKNIKNCIPNKTMLFLLHMVGFEFRAYEDKAKPYSATITMNFRQQHGIRTINWSRLNPDLNKIIYL